MDSVKKHLFDWPVQLLFWLLVTGLIFLSNMQLLRVRESLLYGVLASSFIVAIIYGNASWLIPYYYNRRKMNTYVTLLFIYLIVCAYLRSVGYIYITKSSGWPAPPLRNMYFLAFFTGILTTIVSVFFRLSYDYVIMKEEQAELRADRVETELHMLKQQVQPHFLFNTLNNIYSVARKGSPEAAVLIERLASIMRYFLDEGQHDQVQLADEVRFLKSYMELEAIRLRYELPIDFTTTGDMEPVMIPPLLLLPMAENIFKHGVDKRSNENFARLNLVVEEDRVFFETINRHMPDEYPSGRVGTGLNNLRKRLHLYYGEQFELNTFTNNGEFRVSLSVPSETILKEEVE